MNERVNDIMDALLNKNTIGSSENTEISIEYDCTLCGRSPIERAEYSNVVTEFKASVADAKAYNNITIFLFDLNHEKNRNPRKPNIPNASE
jgi:hypothetical protein